MSELTREVYFPTKPLYLERNAATAAQKPTPFMSFLACIFNYAFQPDNTTPAQVLAGYHLEARTVDKSTKAELSGLQIDGTYYYSNSDQEFPETWILTVKLPDGSCLAVQVEKYIYHRHVDNNGRPVSDEPLVVDYRQGRFDGRPCLVETGCGIYHIPWYAKE